jgi:hypothetical protein
VAADLPGEGRISFRFSRKPRLDRAFSTQESRTPKNCFREPFQTDPGFQP